MRRATARPAANGETAPHLDVVAFVYLAKFYPHLEHGGKLSDEFSEVHPARRRKIKNQFVAVKGIFGVDEFH